VGAGALIAIDTNIILRFLTRQPKAHFEAARELFRNGGLFVSTPVVMEAYFTLTGSVLDFSDEHALEALEAVLRLPGVEVQHADEVFVALAYAQQGLPFKDACVLAFSASAEELMTFDKPFAKRAAKLKLQPVVRHP
jgi:predicted nucleic-acid-binding protein